MSARFSISDLDRYVDEMYSGRQMFLVPYSYRALFTAVLPLSTPNVIIEISANADFIALGLTHNSLSTEPEAAILDKSTPNCRVLLTDTGSGDPFTDRAVALQNYSQNGITPKMFPFPRFLQGRSAVNVQLTNISAAVTYQRIDLNLHGVLVRAWTGGQQ